MSAGSHLGYEGYEDDNPSGDDEMLGFLDGMSPDLGPFIGRDAARRIRELRIALQMVMRECERARVDRSSLTLLGNVHMLAQTALGGADE